VRDTGRSGRAGGWSRSRSLSSALAVALLAAACGGDGGGGGGDATAEGGAAADGPVAEAGFEGDFDWERFDGESIRIVANQHPWQEAIEPLLGEFQELTGIEANVEALPEEQFRQRLQVELTAGSGDIDVFMSSVQNEGARFSQAGWYEDLEPYATDPSSVAPDYDFEDIGEGVIEGHRYDDVLVGIPIQLETQMLYYRTDVFEEHGVEVPTTMEELEEAAATLQEAEPDLTPFAARGRRAAAVTQLSTYLFNFGADWVDDDGQAAFDSPEGIEAIDFYGRMLREYGPSGAANNSWEETLPLFQQGEVAMYTDASAFLPQVLDESESAVTDTVGFAPMPAGPGGEHQTFFGWSIAMSSQSTAKGPAWYFIQWATSPDIVERLQTEGVVGARQSVEFGDDFPEDFVEAFTSSLPVARPQLPPVIPVPEVRDAIGEAVVTSIEGGDVASALENAAEEFDRIVGSS
jgi:multiple sugar transport system substrate-binding protein